jgi:hypothetical protein
MRDAAAFECERICGRDHLAPPVRAQSRARRRNPATVESAKRVQIPARRQHAHSHSPASPLRGLTGARGTWLQNRPGGSAHWISSSTAHDGRCPGMQARGRVAWREGELTAHSRCRRPRFQARSSTIPTGRRHPVRTVCGCGDGGRPVKRCAPPLGFIDLAFGSESRRTSIRAHACEMRKNARAICVRVRSGVVRHRR